MNRLKDQEAQEVQDLVAEARVGNVAAFEALYRSHQAGIFTFIRNLVGERELAADLTQQAFVRAWESLPRLRQVGAFRSWLHRIAVNLVRDEAKSGRARLETVASSLGEGIEPLLAAQDGVGERPEAVVISEELRQQVHSAVAQLPPEQRAVVVMHHLEGLSVAEIAKALGVRPGTVMSRLARGREAMKEHLEPYLEGSNG